MPCQRNQDCGESRKVFLFSVSHLSVDSVQFSTAAYSEENRIMTEKPFDQIKLSKYMANILAAVYELRLEDSQNPRMSLRTCNITELEMGKKIISDKHEKLGHR